MGHLPQCVVFIHPTAKQQAGEIRSSSQVEIVSFGRFGDEASHSGLRFCGEKECEEKIKEGMPGYRPWSPDVRSDMPCQKAVAEAA